jgi:hypothetical protein
MSDVSITNTTVETKKPSTTSFTTLFVLILRTARIITPGRINREGKAIIAINNGGIAVRDRRK